MLLEITDAAVEAVKRAKESEKMRPESCLRVFVESGGCSGLSYSLAFEKEPKETDHVVEKDGIRLLVDARSELYVAGMTLDFQGGLTGRGFVFSNPNAARTCGCGGSFSV